MTFLKAILPLLPTATSFQAHLAVKDGKLSLLLIPQLAPAADDEDAGLAAFRALLARPVKIEVPADADPDAYVVAALNDLAAVRGEAVTELDAYRTALDAAKQAAKAADEARRQEASKKVTPKGKTATKGAAPSKAPAPAPAASASPTDAAAEAADEGDTDATEATDAPGDEGSAAASAPAPAPAAAAGQSNLFANLGL
jgi:hypothetical protein